MLRAMRAEAEARRVLWPKALARAVPRVRNEVLALRQPALLIRRGLLARYDLMDVLDGLAQASGTSGGPPSLWLLVPQPGPARPRVDGVVLPVISAANWARLTEA